MTFKKKFTVQIREMEVQGNDYMTKKEININLKV